MTMNHTAIVKQYLKDKSSADHLELGYPFVTISREAAAGGHTVAREVIRQLEDRNPGKSFAEGWEVFDQKLCVLLVQDPSLKVSFEELVTESYRSEVSQYLREVLAGQAQQYALYKKIFESIRILCKIGKVVVVGRGANHITRDLPHGIHVRLVADEDERVRRMAAMLEVDEKSARSMVREQDRNRSRMVKDYFNKQIDNPLHYDLVCNTQTMHVDEIASIIADLVEKKSKQAQQAGKAIA